MEIIILILIYFVFWYAKKKEKEDIERMNRQRMEAELLRKRQAKQSTKYEAITDSTEVTSTGTATTPYLDSLKEKHKELYEQLKAEKEKQLAGRIDYSKDDNPYTENYVEDYTKNYRQNYSQNYRQNYKQDYSKSVECEHTSESHKKVVSDYKNAVECIHQDEAIIEKNIKREPKLMEMLEDFTNSGAIKIYHDRKSAVTIKGENRITFGNEDDDESIKYF